MGLNRARWTQSGAIFAPRAASNSELIKHGWTINGNPKIVDGPFAKSDAWEFDGSDDDFVVSNGPKVNFETEFSISFWVKFNSVSGLQYIIEKRSGSNEGLEFLINNDNKIRILVDGGGTANAAIMTNELVTDVWYHIVGTYNGATISLYINGILNDTASETGSISNSIDLFIGSNSATSDRVNGHISNILFFDKALTSEEINQIYNNQIFDYDKHLVSFWNLDDPNPRDLVGNNHGVGTSLDSTNIVDGHNGRQLAIDFDGSSDYIITNLIPDSEGTMVSLIKYHSANNGVFFGAFNTNERTFLSINSNAEVSGGIGNDNSSTIKSNKTSSSGQWIFAGLSWDGSTVELIENGDNVYSQPQNGNISPTPLYIGAANNNGPIVSPFDGFIAKALYYNKKLTTIQLKDLYNRTRLGLL